MIKIVSAHIEDVRGIRKLDIDLQQNTFAVVGPNGSGKSGVIDAIEFGITGDIGRLTGRGTKGLTVAQHGPHVDAKNFPDAAVVELVVDIPSLGKTAKITRKVSAANKPTIEPPDADIIAALQEAAEHPEITLARRDILRFILVEPAKRSEEIQAILKLEDIGQTRAAFNTAQNKLKAAHKEASTRVDTARETLQRHLQISQFTAEDVLAAVNVKRQFLSLEKLDELTSETRLDAGLSEEAKTSDFNKVSAERDLSALSAAIEAISDLGAAQIASVLQTIDALDADPDLLRTMRARVIVESGLELIDGPACPLCDHTWPDEAHLRGHLQSKLAKSDEARKLQETLFRDAAALTAHIERLQGLLRQAFKVAKERGHSEGIAAITQWGTDLQGLKTQLSSFDGIVGLADRLRGTWHGLPETFTQTIGSLIDDVAALPDQSATIEAQTFLVTAQLRLDDYRAALRQRVSAETASKCAAATYDLYCQAMEKELNALYDDVEGDFSTFYRLINEDDEDKFTAKLTPNEGKLDFAVNFYGRGLFPPGAYHSEGHQDGMGVCLYLALMKRLSGANFTIALLDDVVMSVDVDHRYQFCKLLKTHFPNTQFIITTHDRLWAAQMRSAGLVTSNTLLAFHSWTVDGGPLVESNTDIWVEISAALDKNKVPTAAHALRLHLEFVARHLADNLAARPVFRSDGNYELGDLMPSVLGQMGKLYGKAAAAAQSWNDEAQKQDIADRKALLSACAAKTNVEQWAVNKAVHYNEWANFGKRDFEPVVAAFKELLACFECDKCQSWIYLTPKGASPESIRCTCSKTNLNLKAKGG